VTSLYFFIHFIYFKFQWLSYIN